MEFILTPVIYFFINQRLAQVISSRIPYFGCHLVTSSISFPEYWHLIGSIPFISCDDEEVPAGIKNREYVDLLCLSHGEYFSYSFYFFDNIFYNASIPLNPYDKLF